MSSGGLKFMFPLEPSAKKNVPLGGMSMCEGGLKRPTLHNAKNIVPQRMSLRSVGLGGDLACVCVCVCVCLCVRVCGRAYVCVCLWIYTYIHIHMQIYIYIYIVLTFVREHVLWQG